MPSEPHKPVRKPRPAVRVYAIPSMDFPPDDARWKSRVHLGFAIVLLLLVGLPLLGYLLPFQAPLELLTLWGIMLPLLLLAWGGAAFFMSLTGTGFRRRSTARRARIERLTRVLLRPGAAARLPHRVLEHELLGMASLRIDAWKPAIMSLPRGVCVLIGKRPTEWSSADRRPVTFEPVEWPRDVGVLFDIGVARGFVLRIGADDLESVAEDDVEYAGADDLEYAGADATNSPADAAPSERQIPKARDSTLKWLSDAVVNFSLLVVAVALIGGCLAAFILGFWYIGVAPALAGNPTVLASLFAFAIVGWVVKQRIRRRTFIMPGAIALATEWPWTSAERVVVLRPQLTAAVYDRGTLLIATDDHLHTISAILGLTHVLVWQSVETQPDATVISTYFRGAHLDE